MKTNIQLCIVTEIRSTHVLPVWGLHEVAYIDISDGQHYLLLAKDMDKAGGPISCEGFVLPRYAYT